MVPTGLQGLPLKFVQHTTDTTCISRSPAGPPNNCPLHLLHLCNLNSMHLPILFEVCSSTAVFPHGLYVRSESLLFSRALSTVLTSQLYQSFPHTASKSDAQPSELCSVRCLLIFCSFRFLKSFSSSCVRL